MLSSQGPVSCNLTMLGRAQMPWLLAKGGGSAIGGWAAARLLAPRRERTFLISVSMRVSLY